MLTLALRPEGLGGGTAKGVVLSVASGIMYAMYALGVRKNMVGMNPIKAVCRGGASGLRPHLVISMLCLAHRHGADGLDPSRRTMSLLVLSAVIGIGSLGHTFYFFSIARLGLVISAGVVQLQPITVSVASFFIFDEKLTTPRVAGRFDGRGGSGGGMLVVQHQQSRAAAAQVAAALRGVG